ncbi:MAG: HEAT repeat domain-containing protein [Leptospiraceae bacterium]|nr:HEAT repeat domain-containing protein [Leptospiraceae bacterium]MCK6380984.1 HEAT repeat domain-containing protein [Leptospiraceae bacterium]
MKNQIVPKWIIFGFVMTLFFCSGPPKPDYLPVPVEEVRSNEEIEKSLWSEEWSEKTQAIVELSQRNYRKVIPKIRVFLKDKNPAVRGTSAIALGTYQDKESTIAIGKMIQNDKEVTSDILIDALARMKDPRGGEFVLPLLESENNIFRLQVVDSLVQMKAGFLGEKILSMAVKNKDIEKAKTYSMALGQLKVRSSENYLIALAEKTESSPTLAATYLALGRIQSKKAIPVLSKAVGKDFPKGRENSVEALLAINDPSCLSYMFPYLSDKEKEVQYYSANVIAGIPSKESGPKLLKVLDEKGKEVAGPVSFAIGRLKYEPARKKLENILLDTSYPDREEIAKSLGWIGNKESVAVLIKVLEEKNGEGRYGAAWSLGVLGSEDALEPLIQAAGSPDRKLSAISIESLGLLKSEKSLPILRSKMKADPNLATFVVSALVSIPGEESRLLLEEYALHKDPIIHQPAIQGLGQRKEIESAHVLLKLITGDNPEVVKISYLALTSITGEKYRSRNEWINWYVKKFGKQPE